MGHTLRSEKKMSENITAENTFTANAEGPAVDHKTGILYACGYGADNGIGKIYPDGTHEQLFEFDEPYWTPNGMRWTANGDALFMADYSGHNVLKFDPTSENMSVFAHSDDFNQPNDLAITDSGVIFLSDPNWADQTGNVWRVDTSGEISLVEADMSTTNGIEVSPDNTRLYVGESVSGDIWKFDLSETGEASNKQLFHRFVDHNYPECQQDGMRTDVDGNLYVARHHCQRIDVLSPDGVIIKEYPLIGEWPSNIAFGGDDGMTAFVTLQDKGWVETFRVDRPGRSWQMHNAAMTSTTPSTTFPSATGACSAMGTVGLLICFLQTLFK